MGMFDTFVGTVKCPKCGKNIDIDFQTKYYDCCLDNFGIGDYIDKVNSNYFYELNDWEGYPVCENCKEEVKVCAAIRNGRLISYIAGYEDIDDLDIMDICEDTKVERQKVIDLLKEEIEDFKEALDTGLNKEKYETVINELKFLLEEVKML